MLVISDKLVDIKTQDIIGFLYQRETNKLAVTKEKAIELGLDCAEFAEYVDANKMEVASWGSYYCVMENELYTLDDDDYCGRPYIDMEDKVAIHGHVFKKISLVELNNEVSIRRMLALERGEVCLW